MCTYGTHNVILYRLNTMTDNAHVVSGKNNYHLSYDTSCEDTSIPKTVKVS